MPARAVLWRAGRVLLSGGIVVGLVTAGAGCGQDVQARRAIPLNVPGGIVPDTVHDGDLSFHENTSDEVRAAFANTRDSLAADGRTWELRRADRLVGFLQVTTVMPEVDLEQERFRTQILAMMSGAIDRITIDETMVWMREANDRAAYLWFGKDIYAVLHLKANEEGIESDKVITQLVRHATRSDNWRPLYLDEEDFI